MNHPVLTSLLPVVLLIASGFVAGKRGWISAGSVKDLSVYFVAAGLIFAGTLLTLVSLHSLVILTTATVVLELAVSRDAALVAQRDGAQVEARPVLATVLTAVRNAVLHSVPIPIIVGLLFAQTGWVLPEVIDKPIQLLGQAFGPLALVMALVMALVG